MKIALVLHKYGVPLDDPCCFPLGFMYVSAVLKEQGHTVKVLNYNLWDYDFVQEMAGCDVVMFTGFEEFKLYIIRDAAICDDLGIKTILGGALATFCPQEMLQYVDTVVVGEGEEVLTRALNAPGVIYGGRPDLDRLPSPDYKGFGVDEYHRRNGLKHIGVLTSRGCPHKCTFCAHTCSFRTRKLASVFAEIDNYAAQYAPDCIVFNDNTLNVSKPRFMAICAGMKERDIPWSAAIRCDVFDEEMAQAASDSVCRYFVVGVESFNQAKLDRLQKGVKVEQIIRTLDLLHKYGIDYHGNVLVGFEGETTQDISQDLWRVPPQYKIFPALVQPFVGTKDGRNRGITPYQEQQLTVNFRNYIESKGKYCYPELAA